MTVVLRAVGFANGVPCPHAGQWLRSFDFEAHNGRGFGIFTQRRHRAMKFADTAAALAFWGRQSETKPLRPDGQPNKPLTALTVTIEKL